MQTLEIAPQELDLKRLHHALTADKQAIYSLLEQPSPDLLRVLLRNPALDEHHLLTLLKQRGLTSALFEIIQHYVDEAGNSYQLAKALARHPETPPQIALGLLPRLYLFDLAELSRHPQATPDQRMAAERLIIQRLPTQPLGNKLTLARQGSAAIVEALLKEGLPQVVAVCLDNPRLKEGALHQFLSSGAASAETISQVARHAHWQHRPNLRLAILKHPRTPLIWYTLWLPRLKRGVVKELGHSPRLTTQQRACIKQYLGEH
jgi:hypothetical protein